MSNFDLFAKSKKGNKALQTSVKSGLEAASGTTISNNSVKRHINVAQKEADCIKADFINELRKRLPLQSSYNEKKLLLMAREPENYVYVIAAAKAAATITFKRREYVDDAFSKYVNGTLNQLMMIGS